MNIEISDKKYWKRLSYDDGLLYVSLLDIDGKNDWRLFKDVNERYHAGNYYNTSGIPEYLIPTLVDSDLIGDDLWIIPVRDDIRLEVSDRVYWKDMGYLDGLLYCSLLSIDGVGDWRMPMNGSDLGGRSWKLGDNILYHSSTFDEVIFTIIPIRY